MSEHDVLRDRVIRGMASFQEAREFVEKLEHYADEGWAWLALALEAGGWKTVFDIPGWAKPAGIAKARGES